MVNISSFYKKIQRVQVPYALGYSLEALVSRKLVSREGCSEVSETTKV